MREIVELADTIEQRVLLGIEDRRRVLFLPRRFWVPDVPSPRKC